MAIDVVCGNVDMAQLSNSKPCYGFLDRELPDRMGNCMSLSRVRDRDS